MRLYKLLLAANLAALANLAVNHIEARSYHQPAPIQVQALQTRTQNGIQVALSSISIAVQHGQNGNDISDVTAVALRQMNSPSGEVVPIPLGESGTYLANGAVVSYSADTGTLSITPHPTAGMATVIHGEKSPVTGTPALIPEGPLVGTPSIPTDAYLTRRKELEAVLSQSI